jgi:hypothetical protein
VVQGNLREGIEVKRNSVLNVDYLLLGGSGSQEGNNSDGTDDALDVSRNSFAELEHSRIEGNHGRAIEVEENSILSLVDTTITGNGISSSYSTDAISVGALSRARINQSTISSGTGRGINVYNGSILRLKETNITVDTSLVQETYSTAISADGSNVEVSNDSGNTHTLSSSSGPEINMDRLSSLSLSGYSFDQASDQSDVSLYTSEFYLNQMPESLTFTAYLGDDSQMYFNQTFSAEIISQLSCSSGTYQNGIQLKRPGVAYLNSNEESVIGSASSSCVLRNNNTAHEDPPSNPSFVKITAGNCESNGYQNLISPHECAQVAGGMLEAISSSSFVTGCYYRPNNTNWYFNSFVNSESASALYSLEVWCKQ